MAIEHGIRQAILKDLKRYTGAPIQASELIQISQEPALRYASPVKSMQEFEELKALGYIEAVPGFAGKYCQISEKGRKQLLNDFAQDAFIWGPSAI